MTVALVTGAGRGIGRETLLALAGRGATVGVLGRPSLHLDEAARAAVETAACVEVFACDLARAGDVVRAARGALEALGPPDAVIHNAAVIARARVESTTLDEWDEQLAVNLRAPFLLTRELLPAMKAARRGRHVYVGSISSVVGTAKSSCYNATKWGLVGFMKSVARELSDTGVTALAVLPGSVDTRMLEGSGFSPRMTARDVATTLVYHALDAPAAHNGAVIEMFGT